MRLELFRVGGDVDREAAEGQALRLRIIDDVGAAEIAAGIAHAAHIHDIACARLNWECLGGRLLLLAHGIEESHRTGLVHLPGRRVVGVSAEEDPLLPERQT